MGYGTVFQHGNERVLGFAEGAGTDGNVLEAHLMNSLHHLHSHQVSFPKMMVKADGHAVMGVAFSQNLLQILLQVTALATDSCSRFYCCLFIRIAVKMSASPKYCFPGFR